MNECFLKSNLLALKQLPGNQQRLYGGNNSKNSKNQQKIQIQWLWSNYQVINGIKKALITQKMQKEINKFLKVWCFLKSNLMTLNQLAGH